jgi:sterol desaturase/sphingolipid hydroxylase (fatty acid hydroxylase superfamily)
LPGNAGNSKVGDMMKKPRKSIQVFENPLLERLTHVHPITPLFVWVPIFSWLFWRSIVVQQVSFSVMAVLGLAGFITWTFFEYVLHRFIMHYEGTSALSRRFHFLIHGLHHDDPNDPTRLVMPPAPALLIGTILFVLFRFILGPIFVEPFFAFVIVGYLCYDYIHFAVHHFKPRTRVGKYLKNYHMSHHFVHADARWGISSPLWDYVFGSLENIKSPSHERHLQERHLQERLLKDEERAV